MKSLLLLISAIFVVSRDVRAEHLHFTEPDLTTTNILSLKVILSEIASNNPSLKSARATWEAMKERVPQARAWEDPRLSFDTSAGRFVNVPEDSFTDQKVMVEQTLPVGRKNVFQGKAAEAEAAGAFEDWRRRQLDLAAQARTAFYRLANGYAQYEVNKKNRELLKQILEITRAKYETGTQSQADVLAAETEMTKLDETAVDFVRDIAESETTLNTLMNRSPQTPVGRPEKTGFEVLQVSREKAEGLALANRPELILAQKKIEAAKARLESAKRGKIPEPSVRFEADRYNGDRAVSEIMLGASINLPWFNRKKYDAAIRENQKMVEAAEHDLETTKMATLGAVRALFTRLDTYRHHTALSQGKLLALSQQTVESKRLSYETDKAGFLDLLMAQREAREIESMYWMHLADYQTTLADLESLGSPGTELEFAL